METDAILLNLDDELAKRLGEAAGQPVVIAHNGVRYRIEPGDPFAFSDPEKMRAAIHAGAGAFKGIDVDQFLVDIREAKPAKQPTEYGPASHYGRNSHSNGRYNDALDEYENVLLKRIEEQN